MTKFEQFSADVHNAFELIGGQKSYDAFVRLISASAAQQEENRIIKLLEDKNNCGGGLSNGNCTCTAIALIKGNK